MREILFRGKEFYTGEWVEGYYVKGVTRHGIVKSFACHPRYGVIPETVGEFTGLTDKNGKKIFEGDICQIKGISYIDETPFVVEWNSEYSCWVWRELSFSSPSDTITPEIAKTAKVIGNIHDNPELLERSNENAE